MEVEQGAGWVNKTVEVAKNQVPLEPGSHMAPPAHNISAPASYTRKTKAQILLAFNSLGTYLHMTAGFC